MNDLLLMLTATLKLAPVPLVNLQDPNLDPNELTNSSNDSDKTVVFNGYSHSSSPEHRNILYELLNKMFQFFFFISSTTLVS
jgi:hypothetical protein